MTNESIDWLSIISAHTRNAPDDPVKPVDELSSLPSQTTLSILPVKPLNQESRVSFVVPVLPPMTTPGKTAIEMARRAILRQRQLMHVVLKLVDHDQINVTSTKAFVVMATF